MSTINVLTLELSQTTDNKGLGGDPKGIDKENSLSFSHLMKEHKDQDKSGNAFNDNGKKERPYRQPREDNYGENGSVASIKDSKNASSDKGMSDISSETIHDIKSSIKNNIETETEIEKDGTDEQTDPEKEIFSSSIPKKNILEQDSLEQAKIEQVKTEKNTPESKKSADLSNNPEQLLSFLSASEKVLSPKEAVQVSSENNYSQNDNELVSTPKKQLISNDVIQSSVLDKSDLQSSTIQTKSALLASTLSTDLSSNQKNVKSSEVLIEKALNTDKTLNTEKVLNTDKTLIAQSISKEVAPESPDLLQKVKALFNSKESLNKPNESTTLDTKTESSNKPPIIEKSIPIESQQSNFKATQAQVELQNKPQENIKVNGASIAHLSTEKDVVKVDHLTSMKNSAIEKKMNSDNDNNKAQNGENQSDNPSGKEQSSQRKETAQSAAFNTVTLNSVPKDSSVKESTLPNSSTLNNSILNSSAEQIELDIASKEYIENELSKQNNTAKVNSGVSPLFDTLMPRESTLVSQNEQRFIDQELSFENVMQTLSTDLAQTQKNTVAQQAETISIMRKDFTDAVKDKVMVMIHQKIQQIEIQLDPPEFGNMQVRINIQNEQAVVSFVVQNQQAKDALEQNMEKLKHMMSDSGVDVGEANVKQESNQSSTQEQDNQDAQGAFKNGEEIGSEHLTNSKNTHVFKASSTGVDYYA